MSGRPPSWAQRGQQTSSESHTASEPSPGRSMEGGPFPGAGGHTCLPKRTVRGGPLLWSHSSRTRHHPGLGLSRAPCESPRIPSHSTPEVRPGAPGAGVGRQTPAGKPDLSGVQRARCPGRGPSTWGEGVRGLSPLAPPPSGGAGPFALPSICRWAGDTCSSRDGPKGRQAAVSPPLVSVTGQQHLSSRGAGSRASEEEGCAGRGAQ